MDSLLHIEDLYKYYFTKTETLHILEGIDLELNYNSSISITGESGSGKSSLLNLIGGLDYATSGSIRITGSDITKLDEVEITHFRNKKIGFVFQSHYLLEEFTALENVMLPYLMNSFNQKAAREKALSLLEVVGMLDRLSHFPSQLSGGERQRVAIARAFVNEPALILADEPTGNLDEKNAGKVLELLFTITQKEHHAMIIVTHSPHIACMADKNYHLEGGILK